jgi:hypothetical protein
MARKHGAKAWRESMARKHGAMWPVAITMFAGRQKGDWLGLKVSHLAQKFDPDAIDPHLRIQSRANSRKSLAQGRPCLVRSGVPCHGCRLRWCDEAGDDREDEPDKAHRGEGEEPDLVHRLDERNEDAS